MKRLIVISLTIVLASGLAVVASPPQPVMAQSTYYVDDDAPNDPGPNNPAISDPLEDGSAEHPFDEIQEGIDAAVSGDTVQVASGIYYENITLKDGVQVLGAGAETTTIDGGGNNIAVRASFVGSETLLDGFTVTNGNTGILLYFSSATVSNNIIAHNHADDYGGGIRIGFCDPARVINNTIVNNSTTGRGGGISVENSTIEITNNVVKENNAGGFGGGIRLFGSSGNITNNVIVANSVGTWVVGGGVYLGRSSPTMANNVIAGNSGGGMMLDYSPAIIVNNIIHGNGGRDAIFKTGLEYPTIVNNTIVDNVGTGIHCDDESFPRAYTHIVNNIIWGNGDDLKDCAATYSNISDGDGGAGNISAPPMFADAAGDDYHLQSSSPCIDAGTNGAPSLPTTDFEGDPRVLPMGGVVDMGADEYMPAEEPAIEATVDFDPDTLNLKSKGKWVTAYIELEAGYDANDIDVTTILLNDTVSAELKPATIGDYDSDGVSDLMVKFDRALVQELLTAGNEVELTVSGELTDGTPFEGTDTIRVIDKGKK